MYKNIDMKNVNNKKKVALVTGGTRGIGRSIVELLLKNNIFVFINYASNDKDVEILNRELGLKFGESFKVIKADLSSMNGAETIVKEVTTFSNRIDYLIFCAGATLKKTFGHIEYDEWRKIFDINLNIPFMLLQMLDEVIEHNGRIIFINTIMSKYPHSTSIAYGVSKASVNMLVSYLVKVYAERKITVNSILVGFANTTMIQRTPDHEARIKNKIALGRFVEPNEIAEFVFFIIQNNYIDGAILEMSGGYDFY